MRIAIITDAWKPQVNGVVTTLSRPRDELEKAGHEVLMITPEGRHSIPCPTYPEIRLAIFQGRKIAAELDTFRPDCVHVATEGTLGWAGRGYCRKRGIRFTTSYHTQFPEYVRARAPIPRAWTYALMRRFHGAAERVLVPTPTIKGILEENGFMNVAVWSRGVDIETFTAGERFAYDLPRPIWINMGRVAVEKNIEQFLELDLPGSKVIVGDGPDRHKLEKQYPDCHFLGYRFGRELAAHLAGADVFVFPSRTDTFGLVMLEAMACGLPVAAYPVTGPVDVVRSGETGILDENLASACKRALTLDRQACIDFAAGRSWGQVTEQFLSRLETQDTGVELESVVDTHP